MQPTISEQIKDRLESALRLEIRKRPDLRIGKDNPDFDLQVICLESKNEEFVACSSVSLLRWKPSAGEKVPFDGLGTISDHIVVTRAVSQLDELAAEMIAHFDTQSVEPCREMWSKLEMLVKHSREQQATTPQPSWVAH